MNPIVLLTVYSQIGGVFCVFVLAMLADSMLDTACLCFAHKYPKFTDHSATKPQCFTTDGSLFGLGCVRGTIDSKTHLTTCCNWCRYYLKCNEPNLMRSLFERRFTSSCDSTSHAAKRWWLHITIFIKKSQASKQRQDILSKTCHTIHSAYPCPHTPFDAILSPQLNIKRTDL